MKKVLCLMAGVALISSCASNKKEEQTEQAEVKTEQVKNPIQEFNDYASKNAFYFDFNKANVNNKKLVVSYVDKINNLEEKTNVVLNGYCDKKGSTEYNKKLGMKRATAVKIALEKNGVKKDVKLGLKSFGKDKYQKYSNNEVENDQANRKVELVASK